MSSILLPSRLSWRTGKTGGRGASLTSTLLDGRLRKGGVTDRRIEGKLEGERLYSQEEKGRRDALQ